MQARGDRFELCELQVWQGTRARPVSIEQVERAIVDACERFEGLRLYADRWQFENSLQRLRGDGVHIERFEFTATSVQRLSESLYRAITSRTLALPAGEIDLRRELLGLVTKESPNGWRFDHRSGGFSDQAVALAMAVHLAEQRSRRSPMRAFVPRGVIPTRTTDLLDPLWNVLHSRQRRGEDVAGGTLPPGTVVAHAPRSMRRRTPTTIGDGMSLVDLASRSASTTDEPRRSEWACAASTPTSDTRKGTPR